MAARVLARLSAHRVSCMQWYRNTTHAASLTHLVSGLGVRTVGNQSVVHVRVAATSGKVQCSPAVLQRAMHQFHPNISACLYMGIESQDEIYTARRTNVPVLVSALWATSALHTSTWPLLAAKCSAVQQFYSNRCIKSPPSHRCVRFQSHHEIYTHRDSHAKTSIKLPRSRS